MIRRHGCTLAELLVSLGVLSALAGLTLPAILSAREFARSAECQSNLHQIGVDIFQNEDQRGRLPNYEYGACVDILCPSFRTVYGQPRAAYDQVCYRQQHWGATRETIIDRSGLPSVTIPLVVELVGVHAGSRFILYLDGHVSKVVE